ncbi:hypothetical protein SEA_EASLEY_59 [Gordonia phage Easley]|uniref:Uncharacterized protein n=1 Tax=Gordonia phage Easley TaxID=2182395 RepID=A0A2U8UN98_9CAUD|nr:hypothetical protein PP510_gp59 [Gordonia phage Easley]AWN05083.1 hypothetical protein SEA_EASLEY_59 [Gordonia phage Easley]
MRLAAATVVAFFLGFAVTFWHNLRPEHTGADQ